MKKTILILIAIIGFVSISEAQSLRQYKKEALKAFLERDYYAALTHYQVVLDVDSSSIETYYNHAESARNFQAYTIAERSYERVASSSEKTNFPQTNFWLGMIKKNLGKYEEATTLFQRYLDNCSPSDSNYAQAQKEVEYLTWASSVIEAPMEEIYIKRLGDEVNTGYNEISPLQIDSSLYFASLRFEKAKDTQLPTRHVTKVLRSDSGEMGEVVGNEFNSDLMHTSNMTINHDKTRIYYTICDYAVSNVIPCDIYYRNINDDGSWAAAIKLPDHINMEGSTSTQPNIAYNATTKTETLYFVSDCAGGKGGKDIWYSPINANGNFGTPINMEAINTELDDITPFYHSASETFYFSSQGYQNLGGFDIFRTNKNGDTWDTVEHMGFPLNSSYNDLYYTINSEETKAYFASNRLGSAYLDASKEACCNDIYEVEIAPVLINILATTFHARTKEALNGVNVQLIEVETVLKEEKHDDDNAYKFDAIKNKEYILIGSRPNYSSDTITISTTDIRSSKDLTGELYLAPLSLDLLALTFDFKNKTNVNGATVQLVKCDGTYVTDLTHLNKNDFLFDMVSPESCYQLITTHPDYFPDTTNVTIAEILIPTRLEKKIYLKLKPVTKETLDKYLPMPLFFDNDHPNPKTTAEFTNLSYPQTTSSYLSRIPTFKSKYGQGLKGEQRIRAEQEIDDFFRTYVKTGIDTLEHFDGYLIRYIEQGNTAELKIRGFASPLASTSYNEALTKRRISSILNHFKTCHRGKLEDFIRDGRLKITQAPHGEVLASEGVSDNPSDKKNSIYSPAASMERRVEIIEIKVEGTEKLGKQN